jgi:hypothetical protein
MNPLLQQAEQETLAKANPQLAPAIQHVVQVGKQLMFGQQTRHMLFKALAQLDPDKIGQSFAGMAVMLYAQGGKKIPMQVLIPAATILLCEGLQFLEDSGKQKIDANYLAAAEKAMGEMLLRLFHATPEVINKIAVAAGAKSGAAPQAAPPSAPGLIAGAAQPAQQQGAV